jgi:hypothetical protein
VIAVPEKGFVLCVQDRGADDLEVRKVYRVLPDKAATTAGYLRVVDDSGEDYLYPTDYFVFLDLPPKARRALAGPRSSGERRRSSNIAVRRTRARVARSGR